MKLCLETHFKSVHEKVKEHQCSFCKNILEEKQILKYTIHDNVKNNHCSFCNKYFGQKFHLKIHIKTRHENNKEHHCSVCNENFGKKTTSQNTCQNSL